jgi:hypothetical protein
LSTIADLKRILKIQLIYFRRFLGFLTLGGLGRAPFPSSFTIRLAEVILMISFLSTLGSSGATSSSTRGRD